MKKILLLIPLLALVVILSGCVIPGGDGPVDTQTTKGVVITDFEPDLDEVFSGQEVRLRLRVKNLGEVTATDVKATLDNVPDYWTITKGECDLGSLARVERELEGGEVHCEFIVTANYPANVDTSFQPVARVTYKYETSTIAKVTLVNIDEARRLRDQGKSLSFTTDQTTTNSPVAISAKTSTPITVFPDKTFDFPLQIDFQNADGTVCHPDCLSTENYNKINYAITWGSTLMPADNLGCTNGEAISLFKGRDNTIVCRLKPQDVTTTAESSVQLKADYGYLIQKSTSVRVKGRAVTS